MAVNTGIERAGTNTHVPYGLTQFVMLDYIEPALIVFCIIFVFLG